jgi:hypothetical protein
VLDIHTDAPLSAADTQHADRLLALARALGTDPEDLDDAVHDAAAHYASNACNNTAAVDDDQAAHNLYDEAGRQAAETVNNTGLDGQIPYLVAHYGTAETERMIRATAH